MKISVIVPAYNEAKTITLILEKLTAIKDVGQIVVVDDASNDQTAALVRAYADKRITLVKQTTNQGKGAAVRAGLASATEEYVLIQDADLEYDPVDIPALLEPIKAGRIQIVYGSRFIGARSNMYYWHFLGNTLLNWIVNVLYNSILSDMETGYKLLPTELMRELDLKSNDFRIEPEITCKLLKRHQKIVEVPITYVGRTYAEGKKITWVDGLKALNTILSIRFRA